MAINPDFSDLFASLNDAGAKYLLVGGYALAIHARPRFTKDLDVLVEATLANGRSYELMPSTRTSLRSSAAPPRSSGSVSV